MKIWVKGAILGLVWSILGFIIEMPKSLEWVEYIIGFPDYLAFKLGFRWQFVFIGGPLVGILLGAIIGYIYGKWMERK